MKEQTFPTNGNGHGWFKTNRSDMIEELYARDPAALGFLEIIAKRAWRGPGVNRHGCSAGEAFIGDFGALNLTEKKYRIIKKTLQKFGLVTYRATSRGTIAKLVSTEIHDINLDDDITDRAVRGGQGADKGRAEGGQGASTGADAGRAEGGQGATNKNLRSEELKNSQEIKEINNSAEGAGVSVSSPSAGEPGALPEVEEKPQTPSQKAIELSRELPLFVKRVCGYNQLPVFTRSTLEETKEFFERNPSFEFWDIIAICALGMKLSRDNPAPEQGVDPYWFSRRFAGRPNKLFETTTEGDYYLARMMVEVKYETDADHDLEWANNLFQSELKRAMKPKK